MEEWKTYTLGDICDLIPGFAFKSSEFGTYGSKVIKIKDIQPPYVLPTELQGVNLGRYDKTRLTKYLVNYGDFVLAMTGATIGKIGRYIGSEPVYINQRVLMFKPKNIVDKNFIYYSITGKQFSQFIANHIDSETAQPNISAKSVGEYIITLPNIKEQRQIGLILKSLDDKIELNQKINDNLEQQAQALFKSWFIDFEPFKDGEFIESELGLIPKGWVIKNLLDISNIFDSKRKPLSAIQRQDMKKLYPYYGATSIMDYVGSYIFDGIYLLMGEDGSVVNENGNPILQYVEGKFWPNNHAHVLQGREGVTTEMLYCMLKDYNVTSIVTGAVQAKISQSNMKKILFPIPQIDILDDFSSFISPMFSKIRSIKVENSILERTRDVLLPKLMSGELKINDLTK